MPVHTEASVGDIQCFRITNGSGVELRCISLGATLTQFKLADGADIVLGLKDIRDHGKDGSLYIGSSVGRVANRIRDSTFSLDGETFHVSANKAPHTLHGGKVGFDKANWTVSSIGDNSVSFQHISSAGDMGYPGTLTATATYSLADNGEVTVQYTATTDKTTIVNLVNHSYFNLSLTDTILDHVLTINGSEYTPLDKELIAIGTLEPVAGTPYDFTSPTSIRKRMDQLENGYDINYNVKGSTELHPTDNTLRLCAILQDPGSGRELKVYSDQPGVQLYTGNYLNASLVGKDGGSPICQYSAVCLETQAWPNAVNNPAAREQMVLQPGATYSSKTVWAPKI